MVQGSFYFILVSQEVYRHSCRSWELFKIKVIKIPQGIIASTWLYPAYTMSIRTSILLFYRRMFSTPQSRFKYIVWFLLAWQVVYLVVFSILPAFICRPLYKAWDPLERQKYFNDWYYYYTQVALFSVSMAFDIFLLVLPLFPVFKLQLPVRKRAGVALLFMLGAA